MNGEPQPTQPSQTNECSICYDEKPSAEFDLSANNLRIVCECYQIDREKRICLTCCGILTRSACPFCRRFNFLRVLGNNVLPPLVFTPLNVGEQSFQTLTNEQVNTLLLPHINNMFSFNSQMYERIHNRGTSEHTELERFYLHLVDNIVDDICNNEDMEYTSNDFVFTAEFPSRILNSTPYDFLQEELPVDIEGRQFYLYLRDGNSYRRYFISSYNSEEYAEKVREEYLRNQIAFFTNDYICRFITNRETRRALDEDPHVLDAIRTAEGHEFLFSLVDADEMTADIIDDGELTLHELIGIDEEDYGSYCTFGWSGSNDPIKYFASIVE